MYIMWGYDLKRSLAMHTKPVYDYQCNTAEARPYPGWSHWSTRGFMHQYFALWAHFWQQFACFPVLFRIKTCFSNGGLWEKRRACGCVKENFMMCLFRKKCVFISFSHTVFMITLLFRPRRRHCIELGYFPYHVWEPKMSMKWKT